MLRETADESFRGQVEAPALPGNLSLVVCGPDGVRSVPMELDRELLIGRHESCHVALHAPALSRYHARFLRRANAVTVEDLGSRHGTWVAGERIERAELSLGTSVRLADVVVAVTLQPSAAQLAHASAALPEAVYVSARMRQLRELLQRVAQTDLSVVVLGETGTGKELAARELHVASARRQAPMRVLNCAAISPQLIQSTLFGHERGAFTGADRARAGVFEEANGGTVFLDEVGELSPAAQASLLRVLESRRLTRVGSTREIPVDVRVVSATHRDLHAMAARGEFRTDLLHRLCVVVVELPALRERRDEITPLARHFLAQLGSDKQFHPRALDHLESRDWPGNLRELRNVIARAALLAQGSLIMESDVAELARASAADADHVGPAILARDSLSAVEALAATDGAPLRARLRSVERAAAQKALETTQGNQRRAAELLGVPLRTFERRLRAWRQAPRA